MARKRSSITLSIAERDKAQLEQLALEFGQTWGDKPNISKLLKAIANHELHIAPNHDWSSDRLKALNLARKNLQDLGKTDEAKAIATLLLERSELKSIPLRQELEAFLQNPVPTWRTDIDRQIRQNQPFRLTYRDAADRPFSFTVHHAHIDRIEKREYLNCWCEETDGNQDIPALSHNWSLRLDRIPEAAIVTCPRNWKSSLDTIDIEFELHRGLAFAYQARKEDRQSEWLDSPTRRKIVRKISSTFWFFREIFPYGEDCIILGPDNIREQFRLKVQYLWNIYHAQT
ncbi:WYL domain-containing protein [Synechococcus sp. PCC 7336]|uniref:WYL domain-containing protein n=1 Tax=Synechococcus sp. PCC 7336 TaxID=195250 RepID=UPI00034BDB93|nr:WYL domain-containing protein [Synechococcus sp. PCC 7336]